MALIRESLFGRLVSALLVVLVVSACSASAGSSSLPNLSYSNQTTLTLSMSVNGTEVETLIPGAAGEVSSSRLPNLPWKVEAKTSKGRVVATMTVKEGDVVISSGAAKGDGVRVDLSCGRLDIWSGPPMLGPMPGPGRPGDCEP
jgi:hypothetical protein